MRIKVTKYPTTCDPLLPPPLDFLQKLSDEEKRAFNTYFLKNVCQPLENSDFFAECCHDCCCFYSADVLNESNMSACHSCGQTYCNDCLPKNMDSFDVMKNTDKDDKMGLNRVDTTCTKFYECFQCQNIKGFSCLVD